jgi:hypothetical protein
MHVRRIVLLMLEDNTLDLRSGPANVVGRLLAARINLLTPEFALVVSMKRQWAVNPLENHRPFGFAHLDARRNQNEVFVAVDDRFKADSFEIASRLQPVPVTDGLAN